MVLRTGKMTGIMTDRGVLVVCEGCGRHTRSGAICAFCGAIVRTERAARAPKRASRAVLFAAAALGVACGARTDLGGIDEDDAAPSDAGRDCHAAMTVYGASFFDSGCPR
jgi:hypothetical protein